MVADTDADYDDRPDYSALPIDPADAFTAISNSRRRQVILSLDRTDGPLTASDLAVEIAAVENEIDPTHVRGEERTRVYISLIQSHLGTLDELGVAEYDDRSKQVTKTSATAPLARHIRRVETSCYVPTNDDSEAADE